VCSPEYALSSGPYMTFASFVGQGRRPNSGTAWRQNSIRHQLRFGFLSNLDHTVQEAIQYLPYQITLLTSNTRCYHNDHLPLAHKHLFLLESEVSLAQRQALTRPLPNPHPIRLNHIPLRINLHLRHAIIEFHIPLTHFPASLDRLDSLLEAQFGREVGFDGSGGSPGDGGGCWSEGAEHWAGEDGLDCWD
jgi:hypothetical protein